MLGVILMNMKMNIIFIIELCKGVKNKKKILYNNSIFLYRFYLSFLLDIKIIHRIRLR